MSTDLQTVRGLASQVLELSKQPVMQSRIDRWTAHNSLKSDRPIIITSPEGAWAEMLTDADLVCTDPFYRSLEYSLRHRIFWANEIGDDVAVTPDFNVGWAVRYGSVGMDVPYTHGENRGSYVWRAPIDLEDIMGGVAKLQARTPSVDRDATFAHKARVEEVLGDILKVGIRGGYWWTGGLTADVIRLLGLEEMMIAMYDDEEGLRALMQWLSDEFLSFTKWFEDEGLLNLCNYNDMIASGGYGFTTELPSAGFDGKVRRSDIWGFAESQETVGVSPEMFGEFIFPYQLPILEKFGLNSYGCCEPVESRWKWISQIPRLRRLSVSPWSDENIVAPMLGDKVIYSRKPNPALVCVGFEEDAIRRDLEQTVSLAKANNNVLEIVLKDTHTVQGDASRFKRWVNIAREVVDKYYGG